MSLESPRFQASEKVLHVNLIPDVRQNLALLWMLGEDFLPFAKMLVQLPG